jgi:peptide/nickel transport system permease protein
MLIFAALSLAPGDPIAQILGSRSTPEQREAMRVTLGLDDPLPVRYWNWLVNALQGDLGLSLAYRQSVSDLLEPRIGTTLTLVLLSTVMILVVGIVLGALGGGIPQLRPVVSFISGLGIAIPGFVAASVLISIFAVRLGWFPTFGAGTGFVDQVWHLTLPAIALSIGWTAYVAQITATAVKEEASREHVETARGRGIPAFVVFRRHIMRNAAIPILTISGLTIAGLVAGSVVVETAFSIDGVGSLLVKSVSSKDYSVVTAIAVLIVMVFVVMTTLIDILQAAIDPQMKAGRK